MQMTTEELKPASPIPSQRSFGETATLVVIVLILLLMGAIAALVDFENPRRLTHGGLQAASAAVAESSPFDGIELYAQGAIVVDLESGSTLYEKNADAQLPLASLTKVALALIVAEVFSPDETVTLPRGVSLSGAPANSSLREQWRVQDIVDYTLVSSSNSGANLLAKLAEERVRTLYPGSPEGDAVLWRMKELSRELGLRNTYFLNVSGLDASETLSGAYGSARDMAVLFGFAASERPPFFARTANSDVRLADADGGVEAFAHNTNEALGSLPGLVMGKTGFTDLAGGNLAIVFEVEPEHLVAAVVLSSSRSGRFNDIEALVQKTREHFTDGERVTR
ncbi:MAG: Peptidase S11 D-alanyl-D-alanine carboxypeptidase 1 [Parcubacteria group bacterium GW2011_GWA2_51_10]|nr:MAG: Peptidase S11 D-alanyl-D-alanine carboxypeptidase 1 [Parcubacteria group bacterium GW2011_GWA2_51_10]